MDAELIKKGLGIADDVRIRISKVSNGYNIRFKKNFLKKENHASILRKNLIKAGYSGQVCMACMNNICNYRNGLISSCEAHHIIPISGGGGDDSCNGIFLCKQHHTGDFGIHQGKWKIEELIEPYKLKVLKEIYVDKVFEKCGGINEKEN